MKASEVEAIIRIGTGYYPSAEPHFNPDSFWVYELAYDIRKEAAVE